jgi:hypothetical protein
LVRLSVDVSMCSLCTCDIVYGCYVVYACDEYYEV